MATVIQEVMQQARHTPYTGHTDNQLKNQAHLKPHRKLLICGYAEEEDCLCEATDAIKSVYQDDSDENDMVQEFNEEEDHQNQLKTQRGVDLFVPEAEDHDSFLAKIGDLNPQSHQVFNQLGHREVNSLPIDDFSSLKLVASTVERVFFANKKMICVESKVFDESPERDGYILTLNPEPPDDRLSANETKDFYSRSASPLITLEYSNKWDPMVSYQIGSEDSDEFLQRFKFNLEEVESATQYFSEVNLLGMAGSGKTTFLHRLVCHTQASNIRGYVLNLDPAVMSLPFGANIDIRDTVRYKEVMKEYNLGPNGGILTSLNLFATKFDEVIYRWTYETAMV